MLNFVLPSSIVLKYRLCPYYVIPPYRAVSFVVVRHHWLGDDYWAVILYRLGFIARSKFGGVYFVGRKETGSFSRWMRSLVFSIYVRAFGPFLWRSTEVRKKHRSTEIHGGQKLREVSTVPLSHAIRVQSQQFGPSKQASDRL